MSVTAIDALRLPESAPELGSRVPAVKVPQPIAEAALRLHSECTLDVRLTAAMVDTLAVLVAASGQPDRLAAALTAWAGEARRLAEQGRSAQIKLEHNIARGKTGGIRATFVLEF